MPARSCARRSVSAISDSGMPNSRSISWRYSVRPPIAAREARRCSARAAHIGCSSRGGPGSTTTVGAGAPLGRRHDEARRRADGLEDRRAERGSSPACGCPPRAPRGRCSASAWRCPRGSRRSARAAASSSTISRPWKRPTTSAVRSSAVGPRPPLVTIRSSPRAARNASACSMSCRAVADDDDRLEVDAQLAQALRRATARCGRTTRPVRTSVPVTTMPARALISSRGPARPVRGGCVWA